MLAAGSMLFGLCACSSEETEVDSVASSEGRVFIRLVNVVGPSESRMTETPKTESDVTEFHNGFIIFGTPKSAIRKHYEIVTDPAKVDPKNDHVILLDDLREGKTFEGIPGDVTNVAIIANVTEDELSPKEFHNGTIRFHNDVLNHVIQLRNQYADNMSHVALYDMKKLVSTGQNSMSASLELKPMCARLEIAKITPGPDIIQYKVDGIYLAGFYSQMYISQISNRDFWTGPEYDTENAAEELNRFYTQYPYLKNEDIRGVAETVNVTNEDGSEGTKEIKVFYPNDEGKVWAYPFFGKYEARDDNDHYGLRLIVKVSDLIVYLKDENGVMQRRDVTKYDIDNGVPAEKAGIRYLNINGFVEDYHNTEAEPIQFYNGNVYTVQNFDITTQNLSDKIMPNDISVNVTLTVKPWTIKKVYPQI